MNLLRRLQPNTLPRIAILLGVLVVISSCAIGYLSYVSSKRIILNNVFDSNLQIAKTLSADIDFSKEADSDSLLLNRLERIWNYFHKPYQGSYLCVIKHDGTLALNTLLPETKGTYVGDMPLASGKTTGPGKILELVSAKMDWVGESVNHAGQNQFAAYAYNQKLDALIAVHVISDHLKHEIYDAVLPWSIGLGLISIILLPLSLGLIYRSFKSSEARYRDLYENAPDMFLSVDASTKEVIACNQTLAKATGFSKKEIIGRPIFEMYDPGCLHDVKQAFESFVKTGYVKNARLQLRKKDGGKIDISLNVSAVRDYKGEIVYSRSIFRDIGEQKRTEEIVKRHTEIVENIQIGLMVYKLEGSGENTSLRLITINPMATKLLGVSKEQFIDKTIDENFPDARRKGIPELLTEVVRSGKAKEVNEFADDEKETEKVWAFKAFPLPDHCAGIAFEDITDKQTAMDAVHESEEKYRTLAESALDGLIFFDLDLKRATSVNQKILEMFKVSREEFFKSPNKRFLPEFQSDGRNSMVEVEKYTKRALDGEKIQFEWENKTADGTVFNTEITLFPMFSKNHRYLITLIKDISIRKKSELALKESETRYRTLVESFTDMIHITDHTNEILYINPAVHALTGYSRDEFQKANYGFVHEEDRERVKGFVSAFLKSKKKYSGKLENRFIDKSGNVRWHSTIISKIHFQGRSVMQFVIHDITEIKKTEEEIRKLNTQLEQRVKERTHQLQELNDELIVINHRLAETQELARLGRWEFDPITGDSVWSDQIYKILGFNQEEPPPNFEEYQKRIHPEDLPNLLEKIELAITEGLNYALEFRHVPPEGHVKYLLSKGQPVYENGKVVKLLGTILDITEAKLTEIELTSKTKALESYSANLKHLHRINTANYQSIDQLFENYLQAGCELLNLDTGIISKIEGETYEIMAIKSDIDSLEKGMKFDLSDTYCRAIVKNKKTISYHHIGNLEKMRGHPAYKNLRLESYLGTYVVVNNKIYGTLNFSSKNKKVAPFEDYKIEILELMSQSLGSFLSTYEADLVKEKAKKALQESEKRFRKLTEIAPVGIYLTDGPGEECEYVNRRWQEITGCSAEEALNGEWVNAVYPEDWDRLVKEWERSLEQNIPFNLEYRFSLPDNAIKWVSGMAVPIMDDSGQITQHLGTITDITDRKLFEEKVSALNQELKQQVAELKVTKKELEAFTYSVSHDLRAPLRAIAGYSKMLEEDFGDSLSGEAKENFEAVIDNTVRMGQLIDDLLAYSRLGKKEMKFTKIDIRRLSEDIFKELSQFEPNRKLNVRLKRMPQAIGDSSMIRQVFSNLISNAIKFTSTRKEAYIEVGHKKIEGQDTYYVKDNGVGFNMKYADKLFGVFQRLHSMEEFEGTGVGLAIVQNIIQRHGGKIWAHSEVNVGTIFYFTILTEEITAYEPEAY